MDYGQHGQNSDSQTFFAVESNKGDVSIPDITKSPDFSNKLSEKDIHHTGNKIINLDEFRKNQVPSSETEGDIEGDNPIRLGEVIDLELPPKAETLKNTKPNQSDIIELNFDHTADSDLGSAVIRKAEKMKKHLLDEKDKPDEFNEAMRNMALEYLKRKYGENAAWKKEVA